jgi:pimeloyl-ACP methyl ester carboxylesterase
MIARLPGVWLGYDDSGRGAPLLLLHGFPHDRSIWGPVRSALAGRARAAGVMTLLRLGHSYGILTVIV